MAVQTHPQIPMSPWQQVDRHVMACILLGIPADQATTPETMQRVEELLDSIAEAYRG